MTAGKRNFLLLAAGFVLLSLCCCGLGSPIPGTEIVFLLIVGWIPFLHRVLPQMEVRWEMVASAVVYVVLFLVGSHYFFRWLHREMSRESRPDTMPIPRAWGWKWTAQIFLLFVLMFVTGLATTGAVHQTEWLVGSKHPIYEGRRERRLRQYCEENLKEIWQALNGYAANHQGQMPESLQALKTWCNEDPKGRRFFHWEITYPPYYLDDAAGESTGSYLYFGKKIRPDSGAHAVLVVDSPENHRRREIHVLYKDGTVDWLENSDATEFLSRLRLAEPSTNPVVEVKRHD